jgi:hypothetical protein
MVGLRTYSGYPGNWLSPAGNPTEYLVLVVRCRQYSDLYRAVFPSEALHGVPAEYFLPGNGDLWLVGVEECGRRNE